MIAKTRMPQGGMCEVTFVLPAGVHARTASVVGEFNGWDRESSPMQCHDDGSFSLAISLESGRTYRFRYWLDGERWENDWAADAYEPNPFGSEDSIVNTLFDVIPAQSQQEEETV